MSCLLDQPISVIGADGTNSNGGAENGAIHYLEMMLGKPLHYLICQLHGNELPFRAVLYFYDGKNKGPHGEDQYQLEPASRTLSPPSQLLHFSQYVLLISQHFLMSWWMI